MAECKKIGIKPFIISHRSKKPYLGNPHDLHAYARRFLEEKVFSKENGLTQEQAFFEVTIEEKIARVKELGCAYFIDDLPKIFDHVDFPNNVRKVLFDPHNKFPAHSIRVDSWSENSQKILGAFKIAHFLSQQGLAAHEFQVERLSGGKNNRVYKVSNQDGSQVYLLKEYYHSTNDERPRLFVESSFIEYAKSHGAPVPKLIAVDHDKNMGLYSFVEGRKIQTGEADANLVQQALRFFQIINREKSGTQGQELRPASDSQFSIKQNIDSVKQRLDRILSIPQQTPIDKQAVEFVKTRLLPTYECLTFGIEEKWNVDEELSKDEQVISPSDFGFHNALLYEDPQSQEKKVTFIDFEYAGWDDPAKMVADFFCQPTVPVPLEFFPLVLASVFKNSPKKVQDIERCKFLTQLHTLKWCCIILNEFSASARREFSNTQSTNQEFKKIQLEKAQTYFKRFPDLQNFLKGMGKASIKRRTCRLCEQPHLEKVVEMPQSAIGGAFVTKDQLETQQDLFSLDLYQCEDCGHVQLTEVVDPKVLFSNYSYFSGSTSLIKHFETYATQVIQDHNLQATDFVLDIGSNDGGFLSFFKKHGSKVLGVDPAENLAKHANEQGIPTLAKMFTKDVAEEIQIEHGKPKIITANNVYAHSDDLIGMTKSIKNLLKDDGVFIFEVSYLVDVMEKMLLGTIFHEHLSYHSVRPLVEFLERHDLELIDVKRVKIQGGSIICTAQHKGGPLQRSAEVDKLIQLEENKGMYKLGAFDLFNQRLRYIKSEVQKITNKIEHNGQTLAAYGAARGGVLFTYLFDIGDKIKFIVDDEPRKIGTFSPGHHIPVVPTSKLSEEKPDYTIILAWIHSKAIIENNQDYINTGGKFITIFPEVGIHPNPKESFQPKETPSQSKETSSKVDQANGKEQVSPTPISKLPTPEPPKESAVDILERELKATPLPKQELSQVTIHVQKNEEPIQEKQKEPDQEKPSQTEQITQQTKQDSPPQQEKTKVPGSHNSSKNLSIITSLHKSTPRDYLSRMNDNKVECMKVANEYGQQYWDGERRFGFGGYTYIPGRWTPVAKALIEMYSLTNNSKVLDIGCGKGYLLYEIKQLLPGITIAGFDISQYAIENSKEEIRDHLFVHKAQDKLPYEDNEFDLVISLTTLHNLILPDMTKALAEMERVAKNKYLVVEAYRNEQELFNLQCWALNCECFFRPEEWAYIYEKVGYTGDYEYIFFE